MSQKLINESAVSVYFLYTFLKKLTTPFNKWEAYKLGIIDEKGKIIKKRRDRTPKELSILTHFDLLALNIKKIIHKLPGGSSKLASFLGALFLMKEAKEKHDLGWYEDVDLLSEAFRDYYESVISNPKLLKATTMLNESKSNFTISQATEIGDELGIDWSVIDKEQFRMGLGVEMEHSDDPQTKVIHNASDLAKVVWAHLKELPDYYTRLKAMESSVTEDAPANSMSGDHIATYPNLIQLRKKPLRKYNNFRDYFKN